MPIASKPLSEIPLIDLRNALRIYEVSFADGMSRVFASAVLVQIVGSVPNIDK